MRVCVCKSVYVSLYECVGMCVSVYACFCVCVSVLCTCLIEL